MTDDAAQTASAGAGGPVSKELNPAYDDPAYRVAVIDLLGGLAYSELSAFERMAEDAGSAPTLEDKVALASMAPASSATSKT